MHHWVATIMGPDDSVYKVCGLSVGLAVEEPWVATAHSGTMTGRHLLPRHHFPTRVPLQATQGTHTMLLSVSKLQTLGPVCLAVWSRDGKLAA